MLKNKLLVALLAATGFMMSAAASAQIYVGGTIGQAKWSDDCKMTTSCDKSSTSYKLLTGYNLDKNFALEASYFSLGEIKATTNIGGLVGNAKVEGTGFDFAGVVKTDFSNEWSGFAKLGVSRIKADANSSIVGLGKYSQDTSSTQPVLGLGVTYKMTNELALRGEFETRRIKLGADKNNVNNFSVGLQYAF